MQLLPSASFTASIPLPPGEVARRIQPRLLRPGFLRAGIKGTATPTKLNLAYVHRFSHNAYQPFLYADLLCTAQGTAIQGCFRLHPFTRGFTYFTFLVILLCATVSAHLALTSSSSSRAPWAVALFFVAAVLHFGFVRICWYLSRRDITRIRAFLEEAVA